MRSRDGCAYWPLVDGHAPRVVILLPRNDPRAARLRRGRVARCPPLVLDLSKQRLVAFSCRGRSFCPSCEKKQQILWAEWLREKLLAPVPHRHVVLTIPRLLRPLLRRRRDLLLDLSQAGAEALTAALRGVLGPNVRPGIVIPSPPRETCSSGTLTSTS